MSHMIRCLLGSPSDWQRFPGVYGFTEEQAPAYDKNPVDNLAPLAKANIPILAPY